MAHRIEAALLYLGVLATFAMMCLTSADAFSRYLFNRPILGALEITEKYLMVAAIFLGLSYAYRGGLFIRVTLLVDRLSGTRAGSPPTISRTSTTLAFCGFMVSATGQQAIRGLSDDTELSTLPLLVGPAYSFVPIGFLALTVILLDRPGARAARPVAALHTRGAFRHLTGAGCGPNVMTIALPMLVLLLCLLAGVPIAVALAGSGMFGIWLITGDLAKVMNIVGLVPFSSVADYSLTTIPMFILMAYFSASCGLARDLYNAAAAWLSHIRGGLAIATVFACGIFGAMSGASTAAASVMSRSPCRRCAATAIPRSSARARSASARRSTSSFRRASPW